jgi:RNA polymerase sigma-70 factor, ECF subfamily
MVGSDGSHGVTEKEAVYNELLVLRCRRRQKEALEELVRTWDRPLLYYIRRLVGDEQESLQILQQTWLKVLQALDRLREPRKLPLWLYRIAHKTAMSHLRSRYSQEALFPPDAAVPDITDNRPEPSFDDAEQIHYGLSRLTLMHREVLTLFFLEDLSLEEIASVLEIPVGTVKSRLHHAKRALKATLEPEEPSHE